MKALKAIESLLQNEIAWIDGTPAASEAAEAETTERSNGRRRGGGGRSRRPRSAKSETAPDNKPVATNDAPKPAETASNDNDQQAKARDDRPKESQRLEPEAKSDKPQSDKPRDDNRRDNKAQGDKSQGERRQGRGGRPANDQPKNSENQRGKQKGMGDHVPAFMMRPVRLP